MRIRIERYAGAACLAFVLLSLVSCSNYRITRTTNSFFKEVARGGPQKEYDLRTVIPDEWERICIGYFPYQKQSHVEKKLGGKIVGKSEIVPNDTNWMFFGINAKNEITQVVLDHEVSIFLGDNFTMSGLGVNCVPREQAVLTPTIRDGKPCLKLGHR